MGLTSLFFFVRLLFSSGDASTTKETVQSLSSKQDHTDGTNRGRVGSYASVGTSHSGDEGNYDSDHSANFDRRVEKYSKSNGNSNPKSLAKSTSAIGLDELIEDRRADGNLRENVVHIEVPFGKPIEEVYDGIHTGPVLGSGISGTVRLVTHKATGIKYAVKVLDLGLVDNGEGLRQLREEIFIMCQVRNAFAACFIFWCCRGHN